MTNSGSGSTLLVPRREDVNIITASRQLLHTQKQASLEKQKALVLTEALSDPDQDKIRGLRTVITDSRYTDTVLKVA